MITFNPNRQQLATIRRLKRQYPYMRVSPAAQQTFRVLIMRPHTGEHTTHIITRGGFIS